jgi:zinc transport system ATP-binding protein
MGATDRVVCLNRHVCCSGEPETVSRHPEYLNLFGPRAAANLAIYTHDHDHAHDLAGEVVALPEGAAGEAPPDRARSGTDAR